MKTIASIVFFLVIVSFSWADDWETYEVIDRLLTTREPGEPIIQDNVVIFTSTSNHRRVGIAFAHENFATTYWFRQLMVVQDPLGAPIRPGQLAPDPFKDSGIKFYTYPIPENLRELEYRIVVNGLWTTDPANPRTRRDPVSGLTMSVLPLPYIPVRHNPLNGLPEGLNFVYKGQPGELVTVAGDFNGWDPFMYELREGPSGYYSITIPLSSGTYQYVFFNRGRRYTDPDNPRRAYARDGSAASVITVP
jgi:hypothetical protein